MRRRRRRRDSRSCALGEYDTACGCAAARETPSAAGGFFGAHLSVPAGPDATASFPAVRTTASSFFPAKARLAAPLGALDRALTDPKALERARGGEFGGDHAPGARRALLERVAAAADFEKSAAGVNVSSNESSASRSRRACSRRASRLRCHALKSLTVRVIALALAVMRGFPRWRVSSNSLVIARSRSSSTDSALFAMNSF